MSKEGIWIDPLKVEAIVNLPPTTLLHQLQSLQGKDNFPHHFVPNYTEISKGFTHFLKKGIPSIWDEISQWSFNSLEKTLISAPLLYPPDYHRGYVLYLATVNSTIAMVFIQDDDDGNDHVVSYLSWNILDNESQYAHVEKLAFLAVHYVQWFRHYIILQKTTVIFDCHPMT